MAPNFPRIYLLKWRIPTDELLPLERTISNLTYSIHEAQVILGEVNTKERAAFELRKAKLFTTEVVRVDPAVTAASSKRRNEHTRPPVKRQRVESIAAEGREVITIDSSTDSEADVDLNDETSYRIRTPQEDTQSSPPPELAASSGKLQSTSPAQSVEGQGGINWDDTVKVLKVDWFKESLKAGKLLPVDPYLVYEGKVTNRPADIAAEARVKVIKLPRAETVKSRAKADVPLYVGQSHTTSKTWDISRKPNQHFVTHPTPLLHKTTSEQENIANLPDLPEWLHTTYSCERPTPLYSPNDRFLGQLKKIKQTRMMNNDKIGVRAYSTAIASIAAYPHTITTVTEVRRLPGCDEKLASLYREWKEYGRIREVDEIDSDPRMAVLNEFWNTWGVGDKGAIAFYNKGYRSRQDLIAYEWDALPRVQKIGLKYYEEFLEKIPRREVEAIGATILKHARKLHKGFEMVITGGYRRGKPESNDVDVILTHPDEDVTSHFLSRLVDRLDDRGWITHTLIHSEKNSNRAQEPVSWKGDTEATGSGFDTLDKALVVWQDLNWPTKEEDLVRDPNMKNPNLHRRVDIIISPWKTAGCAIIGWSGGTTFQRDLRRYCKEKGLKFDSSGIRSRLDGKWMDFEEGADDLLAKEKRVFAELGLTWREPTERCTG